LNNPRRYENEGRIRRIIRTLEENAVSNRHQKKPLIENYLWMPEEFDDCFVDYINHKCIDTTSFRTLLESPVPVAVNDAEAFAKVMSPNAKVKDLILDANTSGKYYSFCLSRAVFSGGTYHCSRCRLCVDWRYWHCESCDKCSYGLSFGRCEHCSASPKNVSSNSCNNEDYNVFSNSNETNCERDEENEYLSQCDITDSSVENPSDLDESFSHGECYCGNSGCENLYCNIIQETCLNGRRNDDLFKSRDTSFVLGNRSYRSRSSESSCKSIVLHGSKDLRYNSTPNLDISHQNAYSNQRAKMMLSKSMNCLLECSFMKHSDYESYLKIAFM